MENAVRFARRRRQRLTLLIGGIAVLVALLLPSWLKLRTLTARSQAVDAEIARLEAGLADLQREHEKLLSDPTYVERVARQEFRATREGEILFKIEDAADGPDVRGSPEPAPPRRETD